MRLGLDGTFKQLQILTIERRDTQQPGNWIHTTVDGNGADPRHDTVGLWSAATSLLCVKPGYILCTETEFLSPLPKK